MINTYELNFDDTVFEPGFLKEFLLIAQPVFQKYGKEIFLIGAAGRNFAFTNCLGIKNSFRMTKDADLALGVKDFNDYNAFISELVQLQQISRTEIEHRFDFVNSNQKIDILPFSSSSFPSVLKWPPDYSIQMTMTGFEEAWVKSFRVNFINQFSMRVISPISLMILKLVAFHDRNNKKDAEDIGILFGQAFNIYKNDIFENEIDWLAAPDFEAEMSGVRYLGKQIFIAIRGNKPLQELLVQIISTELKSDYSAFIAELNGNSNYSKSRKQLEIFLTEIER